MKKIAVIMALLLCSVITSFAQTKTGSTSGTINGHEYVDLGLSVKWATCNVGAYSPSDYGNYYAWGETNTKQVYSRETSTTYGKSIGNISGNVSYDVATNMWGSAWRMPTRAEMDELIYNCKHEWTNIGGHNGYKITGPNGDSIFLPAAGVCSGGLPNYLTDFSGFYWSSTPNGVEYAYILSFIDATNPNCEFKIAYNSRNVGYSIRPVTM